MMNQIELKMNQLRLHGMSKSWIALQESRQLHSLSFQDGMEMLLQSEEQERNNRRFKRLEYNANFRYKASLEEIRTDPQRGLGQNLISLLATCDYIQKGESVLITGATGCGKSFLASALGHQACMRGHKVAYYNIQKLLLKTKMARLDGSIYAFFEKLAKTDMLIMDDFGLALLDNQQQMDFMEIIEDRHARKTTIIASQLPVPNWYDVIPEETIADAILDRLVHSSYKIELTGESMRKKL
jgi:DNA replication protein DnaC